MAYVNRPDFFFGIAFNANPNDQAAVPVWTDLTKYWRSASAIARGKQYELGQTIYATPVFLLRDIDENLNSANTSSPYYPNVVPYRRVVLMGMWPNAGAGNLLNSGTWTGNNVAKPDPSFESYTAGASVPWITAVGGTVPVAGTTTPHTGTKDLTYPLTAAGQGVSWVVPCMPGRQYTTSVYVQQDVAWTQTVFVDTTAGLSTGATGSYQRLTVTFTATQPTHVISVKSSGSHSAAMVLIDDIQHQTGASATTFTTTGAVIYPIMNAYAERFQKVFRDGGFTGYVQIPCVDALAALSQISIATSFINTLTLQYTPDHYWPLSGGASTTAYLPNTSGAATPVLVNKLARTGLGLGQLPAPGAIMNVPGDPGGTGVTFTPPTVLTSPGTGAILATSGTIAFPNVPASALYSCTLACWVIVTKLNAGDPPTLIFPLAASGLTPQPPSMGVNAATGQLETSVGGTLDGAFSPFVYSTDGPNIADGKPHFVAMTIVQDATNTVMRAFVDGAQINTGFTVTNASLGGPLTPSLTGRSVQLGGFFAFGAYEDQLIGSMAHVALWDSALTPVQILDLWNAGEGYPGILSGNQVAQHILTYGKYAGALRISTGSTVMGPPTYTGTLDLLSDSRNTAGAELGNLWAAPDGAIVFEGRNDRFLRLAPLATLGQNVAAGHIPFSEDVEFDTDPQYIYINVRYQRNGGSLAVGGSVADIQAAALKFFYPPFGAGVDVLADATAQDLANWVFYTHNGAVQRVAALLIDAASNPSLWSFVLGIEIGQRLTVSMHAPAANGGAGLTAVNDFFVEQVSHDGVDADTGAWDTTLWLSPVALGTPQSMQPWILEDSTYGQLGVTTKLAP